VFSGVFWCFVVFCGVLCACFFGVSCFFTKQHKTGQKYYKTKTNQNNKIRFVQYSAIRRCAPFSHSENVYKKHSQNTSKKQKVAKHRKTLFFQNTRKTPQNTRKTPAKLRKTPQNTHLL